MTRLWFAVTLFVSAALLFLVQPLLARMVLPRLGGAPAVWNTCMVFFQTALLAGYAYAHAAPAWFGIRRHAALHLVVLCLPLLVLPLSIPLWWPAPTNYDPVLWLTGLLLASAGLPFFAVATSSPLLQRWYALTGSPGAHDPYFLYGASNLGSIIGLLAYPFAMEPTLALPHQSLFWAAGYALLLFMTAGCAFALWRAPAPAASLLPPPPARGETEAIPAPPVTAVRRLRWVLLAFVPSSLMLSVTTYLTTNVAAVPLLWVGPLTLYLLTFVLVFARRPPLSHAVLTRWMPLAVLVVVLAMLSEANEPAFVLIAVHLCGFFWIGLVCHGELARDRPPSARLTEFYLWMSVGGVLGGLFNAFAAPVLFPTILEYPIVLVLACLLRPGTPLAPGKSAGKYDRVLDVALPAGLGVLTVALVLGAQAFGVKPEPVHIAVLLAVPLVVCFTFLDRPVRLGLGVAALLLAGAAYRGEAGKTEYQERSFFAVHRVTSDPAGKFRLLIHGDTIHGRQSLDPAREREPLSYYYRTGPIGQVFTALKGDERLKRVGVVGLGSGALCCYADQGQDWTYFEIDRAVQHIACETGLFTYYQACPAECDVVLGDARLTLAKTGEHFGVLVIDAFSSDAVPMHLLTREALDLYRRRLTPDGILAFNISNRYLDLETVLGDQARYADPPLVCLTQVDVTLSDAEKEAGKDPSVWVIMARDREALDKAVGEGGRWREARRAGAAVWSDDFSNLLGVFKLGGFHPK
jgi:hypothetical protein